jgi:hypothetical protein
MCVVVQQGRTAVTLQVHDSERRRSSYDMALSLFADVDAPTGIRTCQHRGSRLPAPGLRPPTIDEHVELVVSSIEQSRLGNLRFRLQLPARASGKVAALRITRGADNFYLAARSGTVRVRIR